MNADMMHMAILALAALGAGAAVYFLIDAIIPQDTISAKRLKQVMGDETKKHKSASLMDRLGDTRQEGRRKQIEESLRKISDKEKERRKITLAVRLRQAGLHINEKQFYAYSLIAGLFAALLVYVPLRDGTSMIRFGLAGGAFIVGALGLPRWFVSFLMKRRQKAFLDNFADAIDIMVRGLRSGLPVSDAMKVIGKEIPDPVGPEFMQVVDGQKVGIPLDQGVERMYERMPLPEVNFLSIVITIQKQTGGNLSETLGNLSRVLRDRRKMKQKIKAISQEAKASAAIIGALPFVIMIGMAVLSPGYLDPLWHTDVGNLLVGGAAVWMVMGVLIMRKMINFKI